MASIALENLISRLFELRVGKYKLQKRARKGIEYLSCELEVIKVFLCEVSEVSGDQLDEQHKIWAQKVIDLCFDMEDIVDTFIVEVEGLDTSASKTSFEKFFNKMKGKVNKAMAHREMAKKIRGIKKRAVEVAEQLAPHYRYNLDANNPTKETPLDPRITTLYTDVKKLVGIDDAKKEVIARLMKGDDDQRQERIVSIAGIGGLGKTTLAKAVFDEIKGQFECSVFVSLSRNPDINKVLEGILLELNIPLLSGADLDDQIRYLTGTIHNFLQNKRYLIVIDDIWDIAHWNVIRCALSINNMGSRIITTTRIVSVADHVGGCYRLKPLTDENSGKLFYGRIFGQDKCPEQFYEISQKILKKCGGIPLAILTTSLLASKAVCINGWYDVCDSIGLGLGSNPDLDSIRNTLLLSYYDLPSHLKRCLLYLSIFPEDYKIEKGRLIWMWVAEGFVQRIHKQSFLECGEKYFNELVNRSLIQPADVVEGRPQACHVHAIVFDLISTVLGDGKHSLESKPVPRLSLHDDDPTSWRNINMMKLRSLTIFRPAAAVTDPTPSLPSWCHLLRVLDLRDCEIEDLANLGFLGSLAHLRYLGLSSAARKRCTADRLPVEIGKLLFLQMLDLSRTSVDELPSSFAGLTKLMCLRGNMHEWTTRLPDGFLKNLTSLEVLERAIITSECFAEELGHLTRLKVLDVMVCLTNKHMQSLQTCGEAMVKSLGKLNKIKSLVICFSWTSICMDGSVKSLRNLYQLHFNGIGTLPTWIEGASLRVLSHLNIMVRHERREDIQVLGTLPCLCHLTFRVYQRAEQALERSEVGPYAFPRAIACTFGGVQRVQGVVPSMFIGGAMPKLEDYDFSVDLQKDFCGSGAPYTMDDLALAHLPSLRSVTIRVGGARKASEEVLRSVTQKLEREVASHPNRPRLELQIV